MSFVSRNTLRSDRPSMLLALIAGLTLALLPTAPAVADFSLPSDLRDHAVLSCADLEISGASVVTSEGLSTGAAEGDQGHVRSNGDVLLDGGPEVYGDAIAGPGGQIVLSGKPATVTGSQTNAASPFDCSPIDLLVLRSVLEAANDNDSLPLTAKGNPALGGDDGRTLELSGRDSLTLPAGTYLVSDLRLAGNSRLEVEGDVRLLVTGEVDIKGGSHVHLDGDPYTLRLWVAGTSVSLASQSIVHGFLYAPDAAVRLAGRSKLVGGLAGGEVTVVGGSRVRRVVDDAPPELAVTAPVDGETVPGCTIPVTGTATDGEGAVTVAVNGVAATLDADGSFTAEITLGGDDPGLVAATATDAAGNTTTVEVRVSILPPEIALVSPAPGSLVGQRVVTLTGTSGNATAVTVNGVAAGVPGDGTFRLEGFDLGEDGLVTLELVASHCGGSVSQTAVLDLDTLPPEIAIDSPAPGTLYAESPISVGGTVADAHLDSVTVNGVVALVEGGRFTAEGVGLAEGGNTLVATASDALGRSTDSAPVEVILDTTAPVVGITDPVAGAVVATPQITVSGEADDPRLASVSVNGVAADVSAGVFTATGVALAEGETFLVATAVDTLGNSADSPSVVVTLDTLPPEITLDAAALPALTDQTSLTVGGTVSDPHLDRVSVNGVVATVVDGRFVAENVPLAEGDNDLVAQAVDTLGHSASTPPATVTRDTLPPVVAVTTPAAGAELTSRTVTVTGTVDEPHLESVTVAGIVAVVDAGTFTVEGVELPEGESEIVARAVDVLGHAAGSAPVAVTVDTLAPVVRLASPADPLGSAATVTVTGSAEDPHLDAVTVAGLPAVVAADGTFSVDGVPLSEGPNEITATASDTFGHSATSEPVLYVLDTTPPVVEITAPLDGQVVSSFEVIVTGTVAEANLDTLVVAGVPATVAEDGSFSLAVPVGDGVNLLTAVATDRVGLTGEASVQVVLDSLPPGVSVDTPPDGACLAPGTAYDLGGVFADANPATGLDGQPAPVVVAVRSPSGAVSEHAGTLSPDGSRWAVPGVTLGTGDGTVSASVTATDVLGNASRAVASWRLDGTAPVVTLTLDGGPFPGAGVGPAPAAGTSPVLLNRAVAAAATVDDGAGAAPVATLTLDGAAYAAGTPITAEGEHLLVATATDCAGNTTTVHAWFRIDTTPPALVSTNPAAGARLTQGATTFSGTASEALSAASVAVGAGAAAPAAVSGDGFSLSPFPWTEGDNEVTITLTDLAGNRSVHQVAFGVRTSPLTVEILEGGAPLVDGTVFLRPVTPEIRASDSRATVTATLDGAAYAPGSEIATSGQHQLQTTVTDDWGRTASASAGFTVDLSPDPEIAITSPADGDVLPGSTAVVRGTVAGDGVTVTVNGVPAKVSGTTWEAAGVALEPDVTTDLEARVEDGRGRTAVAVVTVRTVTGGPGVLILDPPDGAVTARDRIDVAGVVVGGVRATADGTVRVTGGDGAALSVALDADGAFRAVDVPLAAGLNVLRAEAADPQGRVGTATVSVTADFTPPALAFFADGAPLEEGAAFGQPVTLAVEVSDAETATPPVPVVRVNGVERAEAASPRTEIALSEEGGYVLAVVATDAAGNETRAERSFILDFGGCALADVHPVAGSAISASSVTLAGRSGAAAAVSVRVPLAGGGFQDYPAQVADGTFVAGDVPLPVVGTNELVLVCTDTGGTESTVPHSIERLEAGDGPTVDLVTPADGAVLDADSVTANGTVSGGSVTVNGVPATITPTASGNTFSAAGVALVEGPNVLAARATDGAGRQAADRAVVERDTQAPKVQITRPDNRARLGIAAGGGAVVDVAGLVDLDQEPNLATVTVAGFGGSVTAVVDPATGAFVAAGVPLDPDAGAEVEQTVTATASDSLGHTGQSTVNVLLDPAGPAVVLDAPADLTYYGEGAPASITVSGDAWAAEGAAVSVNGIDLDPATLAWGTPAADGRRHVRFSTEIAVPAGDGAFGVIARATELDGDYAQDRRLLFRDTTPPEVVEMVPVDGTAAVDPNSLMLVLFSEPVLHASLEAADGLTLARAGGTAVVGRRTVAGQAVALAPGAALAAGEAYVFRAGADVTDRAGNALALPAESAFTVAAAGTLEVPVLDALPAVLCASEITVTGSAAPGANLEVRDGDLVFRGFAEADGRFAIPVPAAGSGYHLLRVRAVDPTTGAASAEVSAVVRIDCSAPQVVDAILDRAGGVVRVTFSEALEAATLAVGQAGDAFRVSDAEVPETLYAPALLQTAPEEVQLTLDPAADAWWRERPVRLQVGPPAADLEGNAMAAVFETVFFPGADGGLAGGFLFGEAYDDATGRPLAGAEARLFAAGAALPGTVAEGAEDVPVATALTDGRGRYTFAGDLPAGRYVLVLEAEGHTPVYRRLALSPNRGRVPFDGRLTPVADAAGTVTPPDGAGLTAGGLTFTADPGALPGTEPLAVHLTPLTGQGLPDFLPLGWTPAVVAELRVEQGGVALASGDAGWTAGAVHLELPLPAWVADGEELVAVRHESAGGRWLALPPLERLAGASGEPDRVRVAVTGPGAVAIVVPDADAAFSPPMPAATGDVLAGVEAPESVPALEADLTLDPPVVSPTGRSRARVVARSLDGSTPWPSGTGVQAYLEEKLVLAGGGGQLLEAPFSADLVLYHPRLTDTELAGAAPGAAGAVEFVVSPSPRAAQVLLEVGYENIRLFPFPEEVEREPVVGPTGGSVESPEGVVLEVPEGALSTTVPVAATLLDAGELAALEPVAGYDTVAAVRVDLTGKTLGRSATLSLPAPADLPATDPADPRLILAERVDAAADGRGAYPRMVSRATTADGRIVASPDQAGALPLDGVVREGLYLVLRAQAPLGYATGFVLGSSGLSLDGARAHSDGLGTADLARTGGRYAVPVSAGADRPVRALHPTLDERASATVASLVAGGVASLDLAMSVVAPTVTGFSPADGATGQPVGSVVTVTFSEPLAPGTVTGSVLTLELADSPGLFVDGTVRLEDGVRAVFTPDRPLPPGRTFRARFSGGVADVGGTFYAGQPVAWSFSTSAVVVAGGQVQPELFHVRIPENGVAEIYGEPGALPVVASGEVSWVVTPEIEGPVADPLRETFPAASDGSFTGTVGHPPEHAVDLASRVWVKVFDSAGQLAAEFRLGPFQSADGKGFVAPAGEAVTFVSAEGNEVTVPAGAFDRPTLVRVENLDPATIGVPTPQGMAVGGYVRLDFEGEAAESLRLAVPAPVGAEPGAQVFIGEPIQLPWGRRLKFLSLGAVEQRDDGAYLSNAESLQPFAAGSSSATSTGSVSSGSVSSITATSASGDETGVGVVTGQALPKSFRNSVMQEMRFRSNAALMYEEGVDWSILTGAQGAFPLSLGIMQEAIYNKIADLWVYVPTPHDWNGGFILPVLADEPLEIVRRDTATGWILAETSYDPISPVDGVIDVGFLPAGVDRRPVLTDARPFRLVRFQAPRPDTTEPLALEIEAAGTGGGSVVVSSSGDFPLAPGSRVALYDMTPAVPDDPAVEAASPVAGPATTVCDEAGTWSLAPMAGGDEMLLVVAPGDLDAAQAGTFEFQFDLPLVDLSGTPPDQLATLTDLGPAHGCQVSTAGGYPRELPLIVGQAERNSRLVVTAVSGLAAGHRFRLELNHEALLGQAASQPLWPAGPHTFEFATRPVRGQPLSGMPASEVIGDGFVARDMVKLGNLLVVASEDGQLVAVDVSDSSEVDSLTRHSVFRSNAQSQTRALATDGHNRIYYAGLFGSTWGVKTVRLEDVQTADEPCVDSPAWAEGLPCFGGIQGSVRVAYALGSTTDLTGSEWLAFGTLPSGTPMDMSVLARDERGEELALEEFVSAYKDAALSAMVPDAKGVYTFDVPLVSTLVRSQNGQIEPSLPAGSPVPSPISEWREGTCDGEESWDRYQRVTVENLTTGESWSVDLHNPWFNDGGDGTGSVAGVRARRGDRLRVRYNLRALAHVAVMGSGLTVLDLNRYYGVTQTQQTPGGGQCGRRLGKYEGQEIDWPACAPDSIDLSGMAMTPSVASLGTTGCDAGACRGEGRIDVYSPLLFLGLVHSASEATAPGDLFPKAEVAACIRQVKGTPALVRDAVVAADVDWVYRGVDGAIDGTFAEPDGPFDPRVVSDDLLAVSLGRAGVYVFSVGERSILFSGAGRSLVGHLKVDGHSAYRLQVDPVRKLLFAGGTDEATGQPIIDVWDLTAINGAPGSTYEPVPRATLNAAWSTNQLGIDTAGTGLVYTWDRDAGAKAVPFEDPKFVLAGLYRPEGEEGARPIDAADRATGRFVPLGVPLGAGPTAAGSPEARQDERDATAAFKVRVALPGALGPQLTARVQSLRALPAEAHLGDDDLGAAVMPPGGPGWPDGEHVVTLRRLNDTASDGELAVGYHLYESVETVLLVADPRARRGYARQDAAGTESDEKGQCRRCDWPAYLPDPAGSDPAADDVLELLAGSYVRVYLDVDDSAGADPAVLTATQAALEWFAGHGDNYPAPTGWAAVAGAAAPVPAPIQVSLAEPAANAATWDAGEAGVAVGLTGGDLLLSAVDFQTEGRAIPFSFERVYRSGTLGYGPLGAAGWSSPLFAKIRELPGGEVEYHDGRGAVWRFPPRTLEAPPEGYDDDESGSYFVPEGLYLRLQKLSGDGGWRLVSRDHATARFDASGRLVEIGDRHYRGGTAGERGSHLRLRYDPYGQLHSVVDDLGRRYELRYFDDPAPVAEGGDGPRYGLLRKLTDFVGRTLEFTWDGQRRLTEVRLPEVDNPVDGYAGFSYTGSSRPTLKYAYDPAAGVTTSPTAPSVLLHGEFAPLRLASFTQPQFVEGVSAPRARFGYAGNGRLASVGFPTPANVNGVDSVEWRVERIAGDGGPGPAGEVRVEAPWGHTMDYVLTDGRTTLHRESLVVARPGTAPAEEVVETTYSYAADGRLLETLHPDGGRRALCYADGEGGGGCPSDGAAGGAGDRLVEANVVARVAEALGGSHGAAAYTEIVTTADYQGDNLLSAVTDGESRPIETPVAEASGQDAARFVAEGVSASFQYDPYGRPDQITGGGDAGPTVGFQYGADAAGQPGAGLVRRVTRGDAAFFQELEYDAAYNVEQVRSSYGGRTAVTHDAWDRPVREQSGLSTGGALAPLGAGPCDEAEGSVVERAFDAAGHVVRERRLQDFVDGGTGEVTCRWVERRYRYNLREQVVAVEESHLADPAQPGAVLTTPVETATVVYDEHGRVAEQRAAAVSRPALITRLRYDAAGRVAGTRTGAEGERTVAYDEMSRVVRRTDGDEGAWQGRYDSWGRLFHEESPTGAVTRTRFNRAHQPLETQVYDGDPLTDPAAEVEALTRYELTSFGAVSKVIEELTEGGERRITEYVYDASGRLTHVWSGPEGEPGRVDPARARREAEMRYEAGSGRVVVRAAGGAFGEPPETEEHYTYFADNKSPWADRTALYESVPGAAELVETFVTDVDRDLRGRVVTQVRSDGVRGDYTYDRSSDDLLASRTGAGTETRVSRDARGLPLLVQRPDGRGFTRYAYDLDGAMLRQSTATATGAGLWETAYTYDATGRAVAVDHADSTRSEATYHPDSTVATRLTRDGVTLTFGYDAANRLETVVPSGPSGGTTQLDAGDRFAYDTLSRPTLLERGRPGLAGYDPGLAVGYPSYDLASRPGSEVVGERDPLSWSYDVFSNPTSVELPAGVGRGATSPLTGFTRDFDTLDRLRATGGRGAAGLSPTPLGADWTWGGAARLYAMTTRGALGTASRYGYHNGAGPQVPGLSPDSASDWKLARLSWGSAGTAGPTTAPAVAWGDFGYGYRGNDGAPSDGTKIGRQVLASTTGLGVLSGLGWTWGYDNAVRLTEAVPGTGSIQGRAPPSAEDGDRFRFEYGEGDELLRRLREATGQVEEFESGDYGRLTSRDGVDFAYDGVGRRLDDDRYSYRWDWRGQLVSVEVKAAWPDADGDGEPDASPYAGHRVRYDYDAQGRLTRRLHEGADDGTGTRGFIEDRRFVWEGDRLAAEAAYGGYDSAGDPTNLRWRRTYVPGPTGLDDPPQVMVEIFQPGSPYSGETRTYTYLRDELGTVVGLVAEDEGTDPNHPPVPVRYRYTPYGEVHVESGPELLRARYDADATEVTTTGGTVTQTVADPALSAVGAMVLDWSLGLDAGTLATGVVVEELLAGSGWTPVDPVRVAIGPAPASDGTTTATDDPRLRVLLTDGWDRGKSYRIRLTTALRDRLGRPFAAEDSLEWSVPATVAGSESTPPPVIYDQRFPTHYASAPAAANSAGGRFPGGQSRLFQGLWTDPVTGNAYARARWYDARNGVFLTEDPMGDVDSPNLYAFVGWGPSMYTDPMGLCFGGLKCRDLGTVWWEFTKANAVDVYNVGTGVLDIATLGYVSGTAEGIQTFSATEGTLLERGEAAQKAMQRRQLSVLTLGFSEADDKLQHASELVGIAGIQRGGAMMGEGIGMGDADLFWRGVAETSGGVGNFAGTLAAAGGAGTAAASSSRQAAARSAQQSAVRQRVLANVADSQAARGASNFSQHVAREGQALGAAQVGAGPAHSVANALRLRNQLAAREIASGHAFEKHVIKQGEFPGVSNRAQFSEIIEGVLNHPTHVRTLARGRSAYFDEGSGTLVLRNPAAPDGGTAFIPTNGMNYFQGLQ